MNVLIIHLDPINRIFQLGLAYIASILEEKKHNVSYLALANLDKNILAEKIIKSKSELILISVTSDTFELCKQVIKFINKKTDAPIVLGGIHPTLCPEDCIKIEGILGLCIGEGEYPTCELAEAIEHNRDYSDIKNLWIKKNGDIHKNEIRPLIADLDVLPLPNYTIFKKYTDFEILPAILSRGCPFNCSYCCNHIFRKLYAGKGNYLRHHSISYSIELLTRLIKQFHSAKEIEFFDDTFTVDKEWLSDFLREFSKLGIKFICNSRFDILDEDLIKLLADSGCSNINAAVECGNERIREKVLKRHISNREILDKSKLVKKHKIHLHTHNMLGIPYEEKRDLLKTVALNRLMQVDSVQVSIFSPYPKTDLGELCVTKNWINKRLKPTSYWDFTVLRTPFIKPGIVNYYFLIFPFMVLESGMRLRIKKILYWTMHLYHNSIYRFYRKFRPKISAIIGTSGKKRIKKILYFLRII